MIRGEHWAITDAGLHQVESIAARENVVTKETLEKIELHKESLAAKKAARVDGTVGVQKREGGVAVIPVSGPIFRYANLFTEISGATSTENLSTDFDAAIEDRSVTAILFAFESPGGMTDGANEFQNRVFAARGKKPIIAYVGERACSLAYLYASACDEIVIDAIGEVGAIGVMARSRADTQSASTVTVKSRRASRKNLDPGTEAGKAAMLDTVNAIEDVFVAAIARNRSMTEEAVTQEEGAVLIGQRAVDAGLADRLGSFEGLIAELGGASSGVRPGSYAFNKQEEKIMDKPKTAEERIAELEALSASQKTELEASRKVNATALESQVTAEVAAFIAPLKLAGEGGDLRFNTKELTSIEGMLKGAKLAALGIGPLTDIKTLGGFFATELTAYVAAKSPAAPAGELPKAADLDAGSTPSAAVFSAALMGTDRAAVATVSAFIDKLYAADPKKNKTQHLAEATAAAKAVAAVK